MFWNKQLIAFSVFLNLDYITTIFKQFLFLNLDYITTRAEDLSNTIVSNLAPVYHITRDCYDVELCVLLSLAMSFVNSFVSSLSPLLTLH